MELIERLKALCVDFEAAIDRELISSRIEKTDEFESLALAMIENRTTIIAALQFAEDVEKLGEVMFYLFSENPPEERWQIQFNCVGKICSVNGMDKFTAARLAVAALTKGEA